MSNIVHPDVGWLLLVSQMPTQAVLNPDSFSGMVQCPLKKMASIATMKCASNQESFHCNVGCGFAATPADIEAVRESMRGPELAGDETVTSKGESEIDFKTRAEVLQRSSTAMGAIVEDLRHIGYRHNLPAVEEVGEQLRADVEAVEDTLEMFSNSTGKKKAPTSKSRDKHAAIGTRILRRRPEFASLSAPAAIKQILESSTEPVSRRDLATKIFVTYTDEDMGRALASLSSTLSAGCQKKLWLAIGDGFYALNVDEKV